MPDHRQKSRNLSTGSLNESGDVTVQNDDNSYHESTEILVRSFTLLRMTSDRSTCHPERSEGSYLDLGTRIVGFVIVLNS